MAPAVAAPKSTWWQRMPPAFWVSWLLLGLLWALHQVSRPVEREGVVRVDSAQVSVVSPATVAPMNVSLPHVLDDEAPEWHGRVSYAISWPVNLDYSLKGQTRLALLLPRVGARFRLLLNGHELHNVGWYAPPSRTVNAAWFPNLVELPVALLAERPQDNRLVIQVQVRLLERSGLWPFEIGDSAALADRYHQLYLWQVTGTWMMAMTALLLGVLALFLWQPLRERLFLLMAAASFAHLVRLLLSVLLEPGMPFGWYFYLHRVAFTLYVGFFCLFIEHLFGLRLLLARRLAYFLIGVGPVWMFVVLLTENYSLYRIWAAILALVAAVSLLAVLWRTKLGVTLNRQQGLIMIVALFTLLTGVRDFLVVQLNFSGDADLRWMSVGSLVLMFTLGWVLAQRATSWAREVHRLNDTLAAQVAKREEELRSAFERLRQAEQNRAIEGERRRLMRDMHDGLGSQLVQTLNMVRHPSARADHAAIENMLRHALGELRMTLDSLEPMDGDLPTILGTLRSRVAPALAAAGIELEWAVHEVTPLPYLDSIGVMHLFRCLQEVMANVVKHADADRVRVATWEQDGQVYLAVQDNGCGMPPGDLRSKSGRGLGNVRARVRKLHGTVRWLDARPGTHVEFVFPLVLPEDPPVFTETHPSQY